MLCGACLVSFNLSLAIILRSGYFTLCCGCPCFLFHSSMSWSAICDCDFPGHTHSVDHLIN